MRKIILTLVICLGLLSTAYAELVGYWNFNEGIGNIANDSSPYLNNGILHGPDWVEGYSNTGLNFIRGEDDFVYAPYNSSLDLSSQLTIMAWVNISDMNGLSPIVSKTDRMPNGDYTGDYNYLLTKAIDNRFEFCVPHNMFFLSDSFAVADTWTHIAVTYDGDNARFYLNGQPDGVSPGIGPLLTGYGGADFLIGSLSASYRIPFVGTMDEVRIYNNALTQDEIVRDMNANNPVPEPATLSLLGIGLFGLVFKRRRQ